MLTMSHFAFQPAALAGIQLKNRILRSATHEGMADKNGFQQPDPGKKPGIGRADLLWRPIQFCCLPNVVY